MSIVAFILFLTPVITAAATPLSTFLDRPATVRAIGHDAAGNIFLAGDDNVSGGLLVEKLDSNATNIAYVFHLGGTAYPLVRALAVDAQGNAFLTGYASNGNFPSTAGFNGPIPADASWPFAIKLNPAGEVVYATLFAGPVFAIPGGIAVDAAGNAVITGSAHPDYPATSGAIAMGRGNDQPFVTKLDSSGSKILFSATGLGGQSIAIGPQGDIFLAGSSPTASYPTTTGAVQTGFSLICSLPFCYGDGAQFVTRISADGAQLRYSTFLNGSQGAVNRGLAVDGSGNIYVTGTTVSQDYPYTGAAEGDRPYTFLTKLDSSGSKLLWSVRQGGSSLALDRSGAPVVGGIFAARYGPNQPPSWMPSAPAPFTGTTPATCLPNGTTIGSIAYIERFDPQDGSLAASALLSATDVSNLAMMAVPDGRIVIAGNTSFPTVPISIGAVFSPSAAQRQARGAFLAGLDLSAPSTGPQVACVTDSATLAPAGPVAPGELLSIFGEHLGPAAGVVGYNFDSTPPPTSLAGVQVTFDGIAAPLLYVSESQINTQVPFEVAQKASTVMTVAIRTGPAGNYAPVTTRVLPVIRSAPSVFLDAGASATDCGLSGAASPFVALAQNSDGSRNTCGNPAQPGSQVTLFLNGVAATRGGMLPVTGSINPANPDPYDTRSVSPAPGLLAGIDQVVIPVPEAVSSIYNLAVIIDGIGAAPLSLVNPPSQALVVIWVKR